MPPTKEVSKHLLRRLLRNILVVDSDFDAFILDHFEDVHRRFSAGMDREAKTNLLFQLTKIKSIISSLQEYHPSVWEFYQEHPSQVPSEIVHPSNNSSMQLSNSPEDGDVYQQDEHWYLHLPEEKPALALLKSPGAALLVWGRERCGKTCFIRSLLHAAQQDADEKSVTGIEIDLAEIPIIAPVDERAALDAFCFELASRLLKDSRVSDRDIAKIWHTSLSPGPKLGTILKRHILPSGSESLIIALENADVLFGWHYEEEFFGFLRAWVENCRQTPWSNLRLIISLSMEPTHLMHKIHNSPLFNVMTQIRLRDWNSDQVEVLARAYQISRYDTIKLMTLVGGNPYLVHIALKAAKQLGVELGEILNDRHMAHSLYQSHLDHCAMLLHQNESLHQILCRVLQRANDKIDKSHYERLFRANLLRRDPSGVYQIPYKLYEDFLWNLCPQINHPCK